MKSFLSSKCAKTLIAFLCIPVVFGCSDKNFDWEKAQKTFIEQVQELYAETFEGIFGEIAPDQSWDFSVDRYGDQSSTRAGSEGFSVLGGYDNEDYYSVLSETRTWMDQHMPEGFYKVNGEAQYDGDGNRTFSKNRENNDGKPLVLRVPSDGKIDIIPVYQGFAISYWDMYMVVVDGTNISTTKFWQKNDGLEVEINELKWNYEVLYLQNKKDNTKFAHGLGIGGDSGKTKFAVTNYNNKKILYSYGYPRTEDDVVFSKDFTVLSSHQYGDLGYNPYKPNYSQAEGLHQETTDWRQYIAAESISGLEQDSWYIMEVEIKASGDFSINAGLRPSWGDDENSLNSLSISGKGGDWRNVKVKFQAKASSDSDGSFIVFQTNGTQNFSIKNLKIYKDGGEGFVVGNQWGLYTTLNPSEASEFSWYDDYFILDDYFVYYDEAEGKMKISQFDNRDGSSTKAKYPWELSDEVNDMPQYRWGWPYGGYWLESQEGQELKNIRINLGCDDQKNWKNVQIQKTEESTGMDTRSKRYHFEGLKPGAVVFFYWDTRIPFSRRNRADGKGHYLTSVDEQMIAVNCPVPSNIPSDKHTMIIGCEAGILNDRGDGYDADYNDMLFLLVTQNEPEFIEVKDEKTVIIEYNKRYMVEDLGNTDDIDFNDMVVDLLQSHEETMHFENGILKNVTVGPTTQTATIRAMGGTLDFDLFIGDEKVLTKKDNFTVRTMYNTTRGSIDYNRVLKTFSVPNNAWKPSENNVMFRVHKNDAQEDSNNPDGNTYEIVFPNLGEVPYIIAFDPSKQWRDERHQICKDWLEGKEDAQWEWPEPHDREGDMTYDKWLEINGQN